MASRAVRLRVVVRRAAVLRRRPLVVVRPLPWLHRLPLKLLRAPKSSSIFLRLPMVKWLRPPAPRLRAARPAPRARRVGGVKR